MFRVSLFCITVLMATVTVNAETLKPTEIQLLSLTNEQQSHLSRIIESYRDFSSHKILGIFMWTKSDMRTLQNMKDVKKLKIKLPFISIESTVWNDMSKEPEDGPKVWWGWGDKTKTVPDKITISMDKNNIGITMYSNLEDRSFIMSSMPGSEGSIMVLREF